MSAKTEVNFGASILIMTPTMSAELRLARLRAEGVPALCVQRSLWLLIINLKH